MVFGRFSFFQEEAAIKTEHRLFLWSPMWIDGLSPFYYTKLTNLQGDLARHKGCRIRSLNLCFDSWMGSCWPHKKSNLSNSRENGAQDKRNLEVKDAENGYLTSKEPNESGITRKRSFNSSCLNNHSDNSAMVDVSPSDQRRSHRCSRILPSGASTTIEGLKLNLGFILWTWSWRYEGLILDSQVDLWAEVLKRYSKFGGLVGSVPRKFWVQEEISFTKKGGHYKGEVNRW
jgi:hypothetical protein